MNLKKFRIIAFAVAAALAVMIFCFSAQSADDSSATSNPIVKFICSLLFADFEGYPTDKVFKITEKVSFIVRKAAHFSVYFCLGLFSVLGFLTLNRIHLALRPLLGVLFCVLYAVSDEIHQYFVPGRSCEFRDVCIDSSGVLLATIIVAVFIIFNERFRVFIDNKLSEG